MALAVVVPLAVLGAAPVLSEPDGGPPRAAAPSRPATASPAPCAREGGHGFPVAVRIRGAPDTYRSGAPLREWAIDLENRTSAECRHLHPVIVLTDAGRSLRPEQVRLAFHDGTRWRRATMTGTDQDEAIGVFGGSEPAGPARPAPSAFPGFTLPPGGTRTVRVRLALAAGTDPADVVAVAVLVRRHGVDGDWVGESGAYHFSVVRGA